MQGRRSGILLPIPAFPSRYRIGNMGEKCAKSVVQFMKAAGQSVLNVLPIYEMGQNSSCPYSAIAEVVSHVLIDPEGLIEYGVTMQEIEKIYGNSSSEKFVDYSKAYQNISSLLSIAFERSNIQYGQVYEEYAIYMVAREIYGPYLSNWPDQIRNKESNAIEKIKEKNIKRIKYWEFVAFVAEEQYLRFKQILNKNDILLYGDLPFYPDLNSMSVWTYPEAFEVDPSSFRMMFESGAAPDYFAKDGQHWGTPCYKEFSGGTVNPVFLDFWKERIERASRYYDILRLDHFRGIDSPWKWNTQTGKGQFYNGAGLALVDLIKESSNLSIVAEDLGDLSYGHTRELLKESKFPGIKVAAFGLLDTAGEHWPSNWTNRCIGYTGTHDNEALRNLLPSKSINREHIFRCLGVNNVEDACWQLIHNVMTSKAQLSIISFVDFCNTPRYNVPGTVSDENWSVRLKESDLSLEIAEKLREITIQSGR